jgi:hypothetical protein
MMKEILRNGPINGDFQAPSAFSIYKEGIFSEKGLVHLKKSGTGSLNQFDMFDETELDDFDMVQLGEGSE